MSRCAWRATRARSRSGRPRTRSPYRGRAGGHRPGQSLRSRSGRRLRHQRRRPHPRGAVLPAAGLGLQAHRLRRRGSTPAHHPGLAVRRLAHRHPRSLDRQAWKPENYEDGRFDGNITYRTALLRSKNTCSVKLVEKIGPDKVIALAHAMGINPERPADFKLPENLTSRWAAPDVTPSSSPIATPPSPRAVSSRPHLHPQAGRRHRQIMEETRAEPQEAMRPRSPTWFHR